jgi:hypothetical protein
METCVMRRFRLPTLKDASRLALGIAVLSAPITAACGTAHAQETIQAVRLKEIKDLDKLDPDWIMGMCNLPGLECNKVEEPKLYERKTGAGAEYYAVMVNKTISRLAMKAPGQWEVLNVWNFEKYPAPSRPEGSGDPRMLDIHPALYPAAPDLWAIALLSTQMESYSGGEAGFNKADFVVLDPKASVVTEKQRLYAAVPFSCSKQVRACFSEKDYKKNMPRCHDESSGFLTLKYEPSPSGRFYRWTATWHETAWPAGTPKSAQTKTQTTAVLVPGQSTAALDDVPFCDGGPADQ